MNKLSGTITSISTNDSLCLLELVASGIVIEMVLFDLKPEFVIGTKVNILFKETEVAIGVNFSGEISFCNRLPARITSIRRGKILSYITMQNDAGELASVITTKSADRLNLQEGLDVTAIVKSTQISMDAYHDD